jgi:hypothetical protein
MDDSDWRDVIDNNLNGTANTIRKTLEQLEKRFREGDPVREALANAGRGGETSCCAAERW